MQRFLGVSGGAVALLFSVLAGVQPAMAASPACDAVTAFWGGGVTAVMGGAASGDNIYREYSGFAPGEMINYTATTNGSAGFETVRPGFYIYNGTAGTDEVLLLGGDGVDLNETNTYKVTSASDTYGINVWAGDGAGGQGDATAVVTCVAPPPVAPNSPTAIVAAAGSAQASVTFLAPVSDGGAAITSYAATSSPGGFSASGPSSPLMVSGLANGTAYTFTVTATNSVGTSVASAMSNSVTPKGSQTITFTNPGAQNFGVAPTLTATSTSALPVTFNSSTTGVCTIAPGGLLTLVTAGSCTIAAVQAGDAAFDAAPPVSQTFTVNAIVPGAPTIGTATAATGQASVTFTAPASTGGASITTYTATAIPGGATGTGTSPITVAGLINGTAYTFTVTATNSAGTGTQSAASNAVTPAQAQTITFINPGAQNFGTTPTLSATATSEEPPTFTSATPAVCSITAGGELRFVDGGTCTVHADQGGNAAFLPAPRVSQSFTVNSVFASAPTIGTAVAGDTSASVSFLPPASTGGAAITGYTVTASPGGASGTGTGSPVTVTGLTNGVAYTFTVTATNSIGTGSPSGASNSITPAATQTITFNNPGAQNFGASVTLTATSDSGLTPTFTSSTSGVCTITSAGALTSLAAGTCTINADQAGNGSYLRANQVSQSFSIGAVAPGAPTAPNAVRGDRQAIVSFTAPAFTGGGAITGYTVTSNPDGLTATGASSPISING